MATANDEPTPQPHQPSQSWQDFVASLPPSPQGWLMIALGAGLQDASTAVAIATQNGQVLAARRHLAAALVHLGDALRILTPPESLDAA